MLLALIPFFFECNDPNEFGVELEEQNKKTELKFIEFLLPAKTMLIDSLLTDAISKLLFGRIKDDSVYGDVKARGFAKYQINGGTRPADTLEYIRAFVRMKFSRAMAQSLSDARNDITIYEATDTLFRSVTYLSNSPTPYDDTKPIGSTSGSLALRGDSITEINLNDEFGMALFNKLDTVSLTDYYPALVFEPGDDNQALLTYDMTHDTVGLFVEMISPQGTREYYKFSLQQKNYSQIFKDRSGSKYQNLTESYDVYEEPESTVKLNAAAGLYPLLDLQPYLNFLDSSENIIINKAEIRLKNEPLYELTIPAVSTIIYFFGDENNQINAQAALGNTGMYPGFYSILSNANYLSNQAIKLMVTSYDDGDMEYTQDLTGFSQNLLDSRLSNVDYLTSKIVLSNSNIHDVGYSTISKSDIKLRVYYTKLK